eukprot:GILK01015377.1.p1 GENE.GILK01015377.1~~GILK01015377.1.p1  ORF type:complete len:152 (-),score=11.54 GILK01015377.1:8-424(-)
MESSKSEAEEDDEHSVAYEAPTASNIYDKRTTMVGTLMQSDRTKAPQRRRARELSLQRRETQCIETLADHHFQMADLKSQYFEVLSRIPLPSRIRQNFFPQSKASVAQESKLICVYDPKVGQIIKPASEVNFKSKSAA